MINGYFDIVQFMAVLDQVRQSRNLTWFGVHHQTGVYGVASESRRKRWQRGQGTHAMSVHTMATLALWAGLNVQDYIKQEVKV